jgi:hypothetical protein
MRATFSLHRITPDVGRQSTGNVRLRKPLRIMLIAALGKTPRRKNLLRLILVRIVVHL